MIDYDEDENTSALVRAANELKRVDHLIFVSLKYTRTVDVIKNIIARLINCFDSIFDKLLETLEDQGVIYEIPTAPGQKIKIIRENYTIAPEMEDFLQFYILLRQLNNAEYKALREFRRHVTMEAVLQSGERSEVNIDIITDYYKKTKAFVAYAKQSYFS